MDWYRLSIDETLKRLDTAQGGLPQAEAQMRLSRYGPNRLSEEDRTNKLKILMHQFTSPLIYILLVAGVVAVVLKEYIDAGVIFFVVILNAIIGYIQEFKAAEGVRGLRKMVVPKARVIRDGREVEINSEELVPGDIVLLASGGKVPADLRLIEAIELRVDEALLTGESLPAEKLTNPIPEEGLIPGDQLCMAFMGTVVVFGRGKGVVVETGARTVLGGIAREVREVGIVKAPLQEKIHAFAKWIGIVVLGASTLLFFVGLSIGEGIHHMFMTAVAAAVAAIPEGLPIVVTITMAIGVARMAHQNAIVRKLPAVETLGSTTVIGSDKTGTLTKNEMTVKIIYDGKEIYEVEGSGYDPIGRILHEGKEVDISQRENLQLLLCVGALCNESNVYQVDDGRYEVRGDPMEAALIVAAMKGGLKLEELRQEYQQVAILPFESERGYMATMHRHEAKGVIYVKGAPEKVIEMCAAADGFDAGTILRLTDKFAAQGLRLLAFAYKEVEADLRLLTPHEISRGLVFVGLQGMIDPPRPEAIAAVEGCKKAGIRVVMITGDHAITAMAIAKELRIVDEKADILTGKELEGMSDDDLFERVKHVSVYARVSPQHKLRIAQQLKRHGEIVAITGDGVNDAPALKAAHIGVAMGRGGTDVAREAADMVLADDNFASIFHAVREGRIVFENIRKVIAFLIPTGLAAILSIVATILLGLPIPYLPAQLLWINLVTNGLQDVALAFEPGEEGIIAKPPRDPREGIMSTLLIERTLIVGVLISAGVVYNYIDSLRAGDPIEKARTVAVTTMVFFQFFQAWNSRSELTSVFRMSPIGNPFLFVSMLAATLAQIAVIYLPMLRWVFRTEPISATEWLQVLLVSASVMIVVEVDKWWRRKKRGSRSPSKGR